MTPPLQLGRRTLLRTIACATAAATCGIALTQTAELHTPLPAWTPGHLDIHHIDTGRSNSTLVIFPDATTLLIDAGAATSPIAATMVSPRPSADIAPGSAITRYIQQHAPAPRLDYFFATHIHPDHISALPDIARSIPIAICIDRAFPNFAPGQQPLDADWTRAYLAFLRDRVARGQSVEAARVGSTTQIAPRKQPSTCTVRILSANGRVWNPQTKRVIDALTPTVQAAGGQNNENLFSIALHIRSGAFTYYTGGDLTSDTHDGRLPQLDIESPVARAAGRVDVAVANHHGYFDACGPAFASALDPQVYVLPSWDIGHPASAQMQRLLGAWDGKAHHDVFALELHPSNALENRRFAPLLKSRQGHVVVRVHPGGTTFMVYTLDPTVENGNITGVFGPYRSRTNESHA